MGISTLIPKGSIKSIQRGAINFNGLGSAVVTISTVDPTKCAISVWGTGKVQNGSVFTSRTYQISMTGANQVTVTSNNFGFADNTGTCTWQVVEYY